MFFPELTEIEQRVRESYDVAERALPALLDLPPLELGPELQRRRELWPGVVPLVIGLVEGALERFPGRAYELTVALVGYPVPVLPPPWSVIANVTDGQAWVAHASALRVLGIYDEAHRALDVAVERFGRELAHHYFLATTDVVEAQILADEGRRADALLSIREGAPVILQHGVRESYVRARMIESSIHWDAGDQAAAADVWRLAGDEALQRGDAVLLALLESRVGVFRLRHGSAEAAARNFAVAQRKFEEAGMAHEAVRARRGLAEAATARGRFHEAVSEYFKVQGVLLADGHVAEAAVVATEILELLPIAGRPGEVLSLADSLLHTFAGAGLQWNAMQAWTFVRQRARAGGLTEQDLAAVRRYFQYLPLCPNARFVPPEPER